MKRCKRCNDTISFGEIIVVDTLHDTVLYFCRYICLNDYVEKNALSLMETGQ